MVFSMVRIRHSSTLVQLGAVLVVFGCSSHSPSGLKSTPTVISSESLEAVDTTNRTQNYTKRSDVPPPRNLPIDRADSTNNGIDLSIELVPQFGHGLNVNGISISPNGKVAATASADKTVKLWDVESGILLRQLAIGAQAQDVAILKDGTHAAVVASDEVQIWDIFNAKQTHVFKTEKSPAFRIQRFHEKDWVVLSDAAGGVELWDLTHQKRVRKLAPENPNGRHAVYAMDVSNNDRMISIGSEDGLIQLIDVETTHVLHRLTGHNRTIQSVAFSKDGKMLTSFSADGTIRIWNVEEGREQYTLSYGVPIASGRLIANGTAIVSGYSGTATIIELPSGKSIRKLEPWPGVPLDGVRSIAVTSDGRKSVTADSRNSVLFSNINDGSPIHAIGERRSGPFSIAYSPISELLAISFGGGEVDVWDATLGARLRRIPCSDSERSVSHVAFSSDGKRLFRSAFRSLYVWDSRSFELIRKISAPDPFTIWSLAVSPNGQYVALGGIEHVAVFEVETGRQLWSAEHQMTVNSIAFTDDNGRLIAGSENQNTRVYDTKNGKILTQLTGPRSGLSSIDFLTRDTIMLGAFDVLGLWDIRSGKQIRTYSTHSMGAGVGAFSIDKRWIFGGDDVGILSLYDTSTTARIRQFSAHSDEIQGITPSRNGSLIFSTSFDGTIAVTPSDLLIKGTGAHDPRPMVWLGDRNDWLAYSADGYFDASRRGGSLVAAVRGLDGFRVDQLAVRNNRPDIALKRLGLGTTETLATFFHRHQLRLKRLGFEESELSENLLRAPTATITEFAVTGRRARLRCNFEGMGRKLKRYFVFVNNVAIGNGDGVSLNALQSHVDIDVELSSGRNKVEVSTLNDLGVESLRDVRTVNSEFSAQGDLYYVGFGVSNYKDARLTLKYAHKDAIDLGNAISKMQGLGFDRVYTRIFTDAEVTKANLLGSREFLLQSKSDDTVVVFVAGHGVLGNGPNEPYYFVTYDADMSRLSATAATFDIIEDLVTGIAPRKKLLLLDTCQSGERDTDEEVVRVSAGLTRGLVARGIRPLVFNATGATTGHIRFIGNQDRYIFNDLSRRSGAIVFSASHGSELSYEDDRLQNGMFTYELVQGISGTQADVDKNGTVSTDELRAYVTQAVVKRTDGLQNPTVDRDNLEVLFGFPIQGRRSDASVSPLAPKLLRSNPQTSARNPVSVVVRPGMVTTVVVPSLPSVSSESIPTTPSKSASKPTSTTTLKPASSTSPDTYPPKVRSKSKLPNGAVRRIPRWKRRTN
jgi:WD40 repeat protein